MADEVCLLRAFVSLEEKYTNEKVISALKKSRYEWKIEGKRQKKNVDEEGNKNDHHHEIETKHGREVEEGFDLQWCEYEDIDWEEVFGMKALFLGRKTERKTFANAYCIRKGLIRKANMGYVLRKHCIKFPSSLLHRCVPETWLFEIDHPDYLDEALNDVFEMVADLKKNLGLPPGHPERKSFILKPSITNKGAEIHVFDTEEKLRSIFEPKRQEEEEEEEEEGEVEKEREVEGKRRIPKLLNDYYYYGALKGVKIDSIPEDEPQEQEEDDNNSCISDTGSSVDEVLQIREWVIQRYLDRPLKLNQGRKFHLRVYVLAVSNLRAYVYEDLLALFALKPYDSNNLDDTLSHITNTCIQTEEAEFNELQSVKLFWELEDEVQALLDSLPVENRRFPTGSLALQHVFNELKGCVGECFAAVSSEMTSFQALPNCFELFGFDFLVDEDFNVHLIEANAFPDFKQTGQRLNNLISVLFEQTVAVAIDPFFTSTSPSTFDEEGMTTREVVKDNGKLHLVFDRKLFAAN